MAEAILRQLSATNIFDLREVIAVVTGGGSVRVISRTEATPAQ